MRIGFDVDGVLYKFTKQYHLWLNHSRKMSLDPDIEAHSWTWYEDWETRESFLQNMHDSVDARHLFWQGELYEPGIVQNLHDLRQAGHTIHLVTNRFSGNSLSSEDATRFWTQESGIIYDSLTFSADKTVISTDYFIEDHVSNYDSLDKVGVKVYLVNRPYNLQSDNRRRVNSVDEFTKIILEE